MEEKDELSPVYVVFNTLFEFWFLSEDFKKYSPNVNEYEFTKERAIKTINAMIKRLEEIKEQIK